MKRLALFLVLALIATTSFGALSLTLTRSGAVVTLGYTGADSANLPRAFGLTVSVNNGATIVGIDNYKQGESTAAARGFGIYPATIDINAVTGAVSDYGTPLAVQGAPGAGDQELPSNAFVVEFGSLYAGDANAPATSGTLCKFNVNISGATGDVTVAVGEEDTYRGGVVLEDGTVPATDLTASVVIPGCTAPGAVANVSPANGTTDSNFPQTLTWTAGSGATGYDVYFDTVNPPVTKVSSNQAGLTYTTGTLVNKTTYYWRVDSVNACGTTTGTVWSYTTDCFYMMNATKRATWVSLGKPTCWCNRYFATNGDGVGTDCKIGSLDLAKVKVGWGATSCTDIKYQACADFNMDCKIGALDLAKIKANWGRTLTPCP